MTIYILDRDFNILDAFSVYESLLWTSNVNEPGTFKASFIYSDRMNRHLQRGNLLYKADEDEPVIITRKQLKLNKYGEQTITVQGYTASRYTHQRIIWRKMVMKGTPEKLMYQMVSEQMVNPDDDARRMPNVILGDFQGFNDNEIEKQISYTNLQEALTEVSASTKLGYRMRLDLSVKKLVFEVYQGTDRTFGSDKPCIISTKFRNVYTQEYEEDEANFCNTCLVGGPGEDTERILEVAGGGTGLDRYELFYNASSYSSDDITESELRAQLVQKGTEKLALYYVATAFESKVNMEKLSEVHLGDFVTCLADGWGITLNTQIRSIEKGYSKTEQSFVVTFGDTSPTLVNLIKAKE